MTRVIDYSISERSLPRGRVAYILTVYVDDGASDPETGAVFPTPLRWTTQAMPPDELQAWVDANLATADAVAQATAIQGAEAAASGLSHEIDQVHA